MNDRPQDENSAPDQVDEGKPTVADAHLARGVPGAEPPIEKEAAKVGKRHRSAAGMASIWETTERGVREMGVRRSLKTLLRPESEGRLRLSRAAPGPIPTESASPPSSARTAPRPSPRKRCGRGHAGVLRRACVSELLGQSDYWLGQQGRLTHPMVRRPGATHYEPIGWDEALALDRRRAHGLRSPDEAVFYTSGGHRNEAAFLYQLFVRQFGTNNLPDCSNMCHESSGSALTRPSASARGPSRSRTSTRPTHLHHRPEPRDQPPADADRLREGRAHGAKIVSVNPLPEAG